MTLTDFLSGIADAIRYAEGSTGEINAQDFEDRIRLLNGGQPVEKLLTSILATKIKTVYNVNDILNIDDITVFANYSDGSRKTVTTYNTNADLIDMSISGNKIIIVTYTENNITKTDNINILVESIEPQPIHPDVPQTGTWQLKSTSGKKYIIFGTDDDNIGNPKYFRMLRTYGFPYTMNTEAENLSRNLGNDIDDAIFTSSDAPSLFSNGVTLKDFAQYINANDLGEVAQHGASESVLWNSDKLTGTVLDTAYGTYKTSGGTKTVDEFKTAIMEQLKESDVAQGAVYVENKRNELSETLGFPIYTVGCWGGSPTATIDGIEIGLNSLKDSSYPWREKNYLAASPRIGSFANNTGTYDLCRITEGVNNVIGYIDKMEIGKCVEFFWHMPFNDEKDISKWRTMFDSVKALVDSGKVEVVTRRKYAELGEYVDNPIKSIALSRDGKITEGESDDLSKYTVKATYNDGTYAIVNSEAIIDNSAINTDVAGLYKVSATYRGFNATTSVIVESSGGSDFVDYTLYSGYAMSKGNVTADSGGYGIYVFPIESGTTYYLNASAKSGNHTIGYTDKGVPEKLDTLVDGAQIGSWAKVVNYEITNPSGKAYLYYYYTAGSANTVTLSKTMV